jgi:hypothetical protein
MRELLKHEASKQKKNECLEPFLGGVRSHASPRNTEMARA